jgi:hypothetical protein
MKKIFEWCDWQGSCINSAGSGFLFTSLVRFKDYEIVGIAPALFTSFAFVVP